MSKNTFQVEQFNTSNAPEEMVQYVLDNVEDFGFLYSHALRVMEHERCTLEHADWLLFCYIQDAINDWCFDNEQDPRNYNVEEIFG